MTHSLISEGQAWTAAEAEHAIVQRMAELDAQGWKPGRAHPVVARPNPRTVWTVHAAARLGLTIMPVSPTPTPHQQTAIDAHRCAPVGADTRLRLLTSGTTGQPQRVDLTQTQIDAGVAGSIERLRHRASDSWICCLPLHHVGGLSILYRSARVGGGVRLANGFDAHAVNRMIDDGATMISVVPTMLQRLLDDRNNEPFPDHLRAILLGGAAVSDGLMDRCRAVSAPVALTWGMTETGSQIATREPGDLRNAPDSGRPLPGVTVTVEGGRLVVAGPIAPGGRLVTEDRGRLDADGRVIVTGRGTDFIVSGGENVDLNQVRRLLLARPGVTDVAIVGREDAEWGHRAVAFAVGTPSEDVAAWARVNLAPHERPAEIHWVSALPRTDLGKPNRAALLEQAHALHRLGELRRDGA